MYRESTVNDRLHIKRPYLFARRNGRRRRSVAFFSSLCKQYAYYCVRFDGRRREEKRQRTALDHRLRGRRGGCEMKCKSHPYEYGVGVCASCLRERLLALVAAQNEASARQQHHHQHHHHHGRWRFEPPQPLPQPSVLLNRPVSPYISHRRSVGSDASPAHARIHRFQRFFSTPQIGPTFGAASGGGRGVGEVDGCRKRRFSILKTLFGHHRSEEAEPDLGVSEVSTSGSWLSALIRGRMRSKKNKKSQLSSVTEDEEPPASWRPRRSCRAVDRGMSPAIEDEDDDHESGYSSDDWKRPTPTPMRRLAANHRQQHRSIGAVSGFSVCLSPLVSFGPDSRRSHPTELGISGDLRSPRGSVHHRTPAAGIAALTATRSRKLADIVFRTPYQ